MIGIYRPIAEHLQQFCKDGEWVIYRDAFRWKRFDPSYEPYDYNINDVSTYATDPVLSNHYDGMPLEQLAEDFGYEIDWDTNMHHCAIVSKK